MKFAEKLSSDLFQKRNAQPDSLSIESSECLQKPQQFVCGNLNGGDRKENNFAGETSQGCKVVQRRTFFLKL